MSSNKEITNTTTDYQSLYLYVVEHIDSKGNYDASPLPDNLMREYTYGTEDAAMFRSKTEDGDMEQAKDIYLLLKAWLKNPTQKTKNNLYEKVYTTPIITVFFALAGQLRGEKLSYDLLHLAQEWFYTAKDREAVKFAYLICGLIGLDQVRKSFSEHLYNDLFTMARCEEFTIFLCMACQLSEIRPQKELWFLELRVFWPPLSPVIIRESQLPQLLQQEEIPEDIYLAAANVIITYLIFLLPDRDPAEDNIENSMIPALHIPLELLLQDFLRHAETYAKTPRNLLTIFAIKDRLEVLAAEKKGAVLTANAAQLLIGKCDSLIFYKDWEPEIRASLFDRNGRLNAEIVDFAADLDIDIWPDVIKFYNEHPKDQTALRYLMFAEAGGDEKRIDTRRHLFLDCAEAHLRQYMEDENLLVNFANYLRDYPGEGEPLLQACLTSIYEHAIGMAALSVSAWPRDKVPVELKKAVIQAMQLNQNPFIGMVARGIKEGRDPGDAAEPESVYRDGAAVDY